MSCVGIGDAKIRIYIGWLCGRILRSRAPAVRSFTALSVVPEYVGEGGLP